VNPGCPLHGGDRCQAVQVESEAPTWTETYYATLEHLTAEDAAWAAEVEAERLSAHWGHVRVRRWGRRTWKVWEPGEDWVTGWVRVVDHPDLDHA
jgi:hypothetical protein